jgi:hypothetical protein
MATWQNIEDVVALWHREANEPTWTDLEELELERDELRRRDCECGCCRKIAVGLHASMSLMLGLCADALRPELRLAAANRSSLKSRGW